MQHKINAAVDLCHEASFKAGWWNDTDTGEDLRTNPMCFSQKIALIHSELSEALEGDRKDSQDSHLPQYSARAVELADAAIRLFDLCGAYNIDLGDIVVAKLAYNKSRADHQLSARATAGGKAY